MLYDVLAVNINDQTVRVLDRNLSAENAEAVIKFAVYRRGVETEFYTKREAGTYAEGDKIGSM